MIIMERIMFKWSILIKIIFFDADYAINKIKGIGNDEEQKTNSSFIHESNS